MKRNGMSCSEAGKLGAEKAKIIWKQIKLKNVEKYNGNSKICKNKKCENLIPYNKRGNIFCSHSCSASHNNLGVRKHGKAAGNCAFCGKEVKANSYKYCDRKCMGEHRRAQTNKKIENGEWVYQKQIKRYLLEKRGHKCESCNIEKWCNQPVPLVMDHINGNSDNNSLDNLRLLCCNCDAQTPTYKSKNKGNGRHFRRQRYAEGKSY